MTMRTLLAALVIAATFSAASSNAQTILDNDGCVYDYGLQAPETSAYVNTYVMENRCPGRYFTIFYRHSYANGTERSNSFTLGPGRRAVAHLGRGEHYEVTAIQ